MNGRATAAYWIQARDDARATATRAHNPEEWRKLADYYDEMAITATERELERKIWSAFAEFDAAEKQEVGESQ